MKKIIIGLCVIVVVAVFGGRAWYLHMQKQTENANEKVIKIGAILPLTSGVAKIGNDILESLKIAEKNINNDPQYHFKVKMIMEDGKHQPKASLDAFHKLMAKKVDTMIVFSDVPASAVSRFIQDSKMPTLVIGGHPYHNYMFKVPVSNEIMGYTYGKYIPQKMNLKRIGAIYQDAYLAKETTEAFIKGAKEKGAEITSIEKYKDDILDTKAQVLKLLDKNPDAVFVYGFGDKAFPATINYMRTLGYDKPILSVFVMSEALPFLKDTSNLYFLDLSFQSAYDTYDYLTDHHKKFPGVDMNATVVFSYIAAHMLAQVANKVGTENPDLFMKELRATPYFNTPYGKMRIVGEETYLPMFAKKVLPDGTIEVVEEIKE